MADDTGQLSWYSPISRSHPARRLHVPARLQRVLEGRVSHRDRRRLRRSDPPAQRPSAIRRTRARGIARIIDNYISLHHHAVRALGGSLGWRSSGRRPLRSVARRAFFSESMFHRATDASKVALVALVVGSAAADSPCWIPSGPHLEQFGAVEIRARVHADAGSQLELRRSSCEVSASSFNF